MKTQLAFHLLAAALVSWTAACSSPEPKTVADESASESRVVSTGRKPLDPKRIVYSMRGNENDYRKCFLRAMGSRGIVEVRFNVDPRGRVEDVNVVRSTIPQGHVADCIAERLGAQRFGNLQAEASGRWTFVFRLTDRIDEDEREKLLAELDEHAVGPAIRLVPGSAGELEPGRVEEFVLARYPLFAHCYRDSIGRRGESRGVFQVRMTIDEQGRVSEIEDAGSIMPDPYAVDCMAEAFYAMTFPSPSGGPVTVDYRLDLE